MIGLVMAGGKGTRMAISDEKLLLVYEKPVILHVIEALQNSKCISRVVAATSDNSPKTNHLLTELGIETIRTSGSGYVDDLNFALSKLDGLVLVVSGDLPLLDGKIVRDIVSAYDGGATWQSFLVTDDLLKSLDIKSEFSVMFNGKKCHFSGISIVNTKNLSSEIHETYAILDDRRIALNLNTKHEYELLKNS
ncbi:MAG TPA: NTP transferase domain-containing protein [Candidatus Nitrosotenuis sp.]|nr:NTP transferase domain-containing protein [Candidatus Nitrosotenuis sp.]